MKPVILITSYHVDKKELIGNQIRGVRGQDLNICTYDYINAVRKAGGLPIVVPNTRDDDELEALLQLCDGVLFSGGEDIHPKYYNEVISVSNMKIVDKRDEFEFKLAKRLLEDERPVLGICRGMQVLNVAAGGTLYQDIDSLFETRIRHKNLDFFKWEIAHHVSIEPGTKLYDVYQAERNGVNSFHHQAVKDIADSFKINSQADDGIVEGFEMEGDRFFVAVQWHPEMMFEKFDEELEIFKHFVRSAEDYRNKKEESDN